MEQQCGRKIELRLTKEQERICIRSCAAARRAYNWKLAQQNAAYEEAKKLVPEGSKPKCKLGTKNINTHSSWSHADNHSPNFKNETVFVYGLIDNATEVQPEDIDITDVEEVPNFKDGILDENMDRRIVMKE